MTQFNPDAAEFDQDAAADFCCNCSGRITGRMIRRATERGDLRSVRLGPGGRHLYSRTDLAEWLRSRREISNAEAASDR